jgi:hypothetical protein
MKKLRVLLASALLAGAVAVNGQDSGTSGSQDKTGTATQGGGGAGVGKQGETSVPESQTEGQKGAQGQAETHDQSGTQAPAGGSGGTAASEKHDATKDYYKEMTVIESREVPNSLRSTLGGPQYKGWETNSTIYKHRTNEHFLLEMREGNKTKSYHFDRDGNAVKENDQ